MKTVKSKPANRPLETNKRLAALQETILSASALAEQIETLGKKLDGLKDDIREQFLAMMGPDDTNLSIDTDIGKCTVVRVKDAFVVAKGFDPDVLKKTMSKELWDTFFVMEPSLRSTACDAFKRLDDGSGKIQGHESPFAFQPRNAQVRLPK